MKTALICLLSTASLFACGLVPRNDAGWTLDDALADAPIVCSGPQQCSDYWRRTQYWISTHSGFKIQLATDTAIDTYGAPDYSLSWAYSARREPGINGQDRITISPSCGRAPICQQKRSDVVRDARAYITAN